MKTLLERLRSRRLASAFVVLTTLSVVLVVGSYAAHGVRGQVQSNSSADATPLKVVNSTLPPNDFVRIAKQVGPAVVNINVQILPKQAETKKKQNPRLRAQPRSQSPEDGDDDDDQGQAQNGIPDFFYKFFGGQAPGMPGAGEDPNQGVQESLGSGFIVDPKGYIITNYHVVEKADKIYVKLATDPDNQDRGRSARLIGADKATDLAVIKIDTSTPLPTVKLGNSDQAQVGDWVEAIGSPFALSQSVTAGIISAKNRTIQPGASGQFQHFIQTDAAINPGNSGGPLLNMNGEVIGVNTAIYTQSGGYQGLGFAMPSNTVVDIYNDLISPSHKVVRGSIGITFQQGLSESVTRIYGNGVIVQSVTPGGPADKAGLKERDVITHIDGRPIKDGDDLINEVAGRRPGSSARIGFLRDGKPQDATLTIGDRDKIYAELTGQQPQESDEDQGDLGETKLGIVVRPAPQSTVSKIHSDGMLIQSVRSGSFADLQGLEPGLVITRINRQSVSTRDQLNAVVGKLHPGDDVVFEVIDPHHADQGINIIGGRLQ
ncbi:trypsin-like peptidase domain-containing protein [Telmatobacter bradus]|uniref:trypsin-like peptidase domain-containing protein n=1 Tax=Telmatobacter bradus TaxID=474953 RepID=UPI003B42A961